MAAWMGEQLETVQPLRDGWPLDFNFRVLNEALAWSISQEDVNKIRCWLRLGAEPNAKTSHDETNVYQAVKQNRPLSLAILLEAKANPNLAGERLDDTPLHAAVQHGYGKMVIALIQANASLEHTLKNGQTPLHLAAERNAPDRLKILFPGMPSIIPL